MASKSAAGRLHAYISLQSVSIVWQCLAQTVTSYAQLGCSDAAALFRFGGFLPLFIALLLARQHQTLNQKNPPLNLPSNSQLEQQLSTLVQAYQKTEPAECLNCMEISRTNYNRFPLPSLAAVMLQPCQGLGVSQLGA